MKEFGVKKTLIIYGSDRIMKNGLFDVATKSLSANGIEFCKIGGVKSNPVLSKVNEAINLAKKEGVDSVLAIGGGSVLDSAKAVAAGVKYNGDVWDFFTSKCPKEALMIFDIITLAATGSEMNGGAVVTNEVTKEKFAMHGACLYPKVSVVNPLLQASVSKEYLVYSASDIIAHSIEGYFTASVQPEIINLYIEANIKTVMKTTEILLKEPENYDARGEFAWAATMALNGLTYVGTAGYSYPNHMIEHAIGAVVDCAHGAGLKRFGKEIFGVDDADEAIKKLKEWFSKIGTPTSLIEIGVDESNLDEIMALVYDYAKGRGLEQIYTKEAISEIFALAR